MSLICPISSKVVAPRDSFLLPIQMERLSRSVLALCIVVTEVQERRLGYPEEYHAGKIPSI